MELPLGFKNNMAEILKDEYSDYENSLDKDRLYGIRINTLKISPENIKNIINETLEPVEWCDEGYYYNKDYRPSKSPYYHAGLFYIQEPSAMLPSSVLPISTGDRVLDLCAAPGGKTTHIGSKLNGTGLIVSNDISTSRAKVLLKNIELFGIKNSCVINETPEKLSKKFPKFFDKILIDAPCSGEGMFRKDPNAIKVWDETIAEKYSSLQDKLLLYAKEMLADGGIIAYSTCTFNTLENEETIKYFLENNEEFSLDYIDHEKYGISQGIDIATTNGVSLKGCGRIFPHRQKGEGHFIALLKHNLPKKENKPNLYNSAKIKDIDYFNEFCDKYLNIRFDGNIILHESSLMLLPDGINDLNGLRVIRSGLYLGDLKTKRFEPSQDLAMVLKDNEAKNVIDFNINDEDLFKYLRGDSFYVEGNEGYNLVCLSGYPLGWGKIVNKRLKNKYLKFWISHNLK